MSAVPCSVAIDEKRHDQEQMAKDIIAECGQVDKNELFEAALESFKTYKTHEYTNEAEYVFENFDLPLMLARYADMRDDPAEFGRMMIKELDRSLKL